MSETSRLDALLERVGPGRAFAAFSEALSDAAVFAVDGDRQIVHWSEGAEKVLGFSRDEAVGRLCLTAIRCRTCALGCGLARHGTISAFPLDHYRRDERWVPTLKYAKAFFDDDGEFAGGIEVLIPTGPPQAEEGQAAEKLALPPDAVEFHGLVSRHPGMLRVFQTVTNVAETDATVLVRGESGSGKELVARAIHDESHRRDGPFVAVSCAALTASLIESELFGHVRGAFTGAVGDRAGLFAQADGGTLFLDEVAELPLDVQSKLLRVLEERVVTPVGGNREVAVDVRMVTATHRALRQEVRAGRFREDLMYRLRVVPIFLPPLRERRGDVELLLRFFFRLFNRAGPRQITSVSPDAMRALLGHEWPGNVRELRNVVEYAFAVGRGDELLLADLPPEVRGEQEDAERPTDRAESAQASGERERIREALMLSEGRISAAAERLGVSRATFWRKRRRYGL